MKARLKAIASHLPSTRLTNEQLAADFPDWTPAKILEKTGIRERRVAAPGECASDLGVEAAEKLFASGACRREEIDYLIFCTQSPDYFLPATACLLQSRLKLKTSCGALDINQGCSGFVYGLSLAKGLVETGAAANVLLITAETYSKFINPRDRSVRTLFGDGAAASLITAAESERELIGPFVFGTDGTGAHQLIVKAGGHRTPPTPENAIVKEAEGGNYRSEQNLYMDGPEIFNFTIRVLPETVVRLLEKAQLTFEQVDWFVFHQANRFMLEFLRRKMRIPTEKFPVAMEGCGNTVSSTIPIVLEQMQANGQFKPGQQIMLVGFGVGLSWAACMLCVNENRADC